MSMSYEMAKSYVKNQLAKAVSAGVLKGETESSASHTHKFAVMYDEHNKMFVGETDFDGVGPHTHYIMMSIRDIVETHLDDDPQPRTEDDLVAFVDIANTPENMRRIIDFYNLKSITMESHPGGPDGHVHSLTVKFAGHTIDRMGRKLEASIFDNSSEIDREIAEIKEAKVNGENELENILNNHISETFNSEEEVVENEVEIPEETVVEAIDYEALAQNIINDITKQAKSAEEELMNRLKKNIEAREEGKTKYE